MDEAKRNEILAAAKVWFTDVIIAAHRSNAEKARDLSVFNINPFTLTYLGIFMSGNVEPETLARALVYPRMLGSSIATIFGTHMQAFLTDTLGFGSGIAGIDIEYIDQLDQRRKYAQIKAGPNVINRDDVTTINNHFREFRNRARTNNLRLEEGDTVFGLLYGDPGEENAFVRELARDNTVHMGKAFWHHLTGDEDFYEKIIAVITEAAREQQAEGNLMEEVIQDLIPQIREKMSALYEADGGENPAIL